MLLTINRNANSCEDLYWDTVGDRYVLNTRMQWDGRKCLDKRDWNKLDAGETKKGGRWSFPGRSFETICKQSQLLWKRAPIRETRGQFNGGQEKHRCDYLNETCCSFDYLKRLASQGWGWWISLTLAGRNVYWLKITCWLDKSPD